MEDIENVTVLPGQPGHAALHTEERAAINRRVSRSHTLDGGTVADLGDVSGVLNLDRNVAPTVKVRAVGNIDVSIAGWAEVGVTQSFGLFVYQDSVGGRTVTFPASVNLPVGFAPAPTTANTVTIYRIFSPDVGRSVFVEIIGTYQVGDRFNQAVLALAGLRYYLPLTDGSGTVAQDATTNDLDGAYVGTVALSSQSITPSSSAREATFLRANNAYVAAQPYAAGRTASPWSLGFVVSAPDPGLTTPGEIYTEADTSVTNPLLRIGSKDDAAPSDRLQLLWRASSGTIRVARTMPSVYFNSVPHVVIVSYDGVGNFTVYRDGQVDDTFAVGTSTSVVTTTLATWAALRRAATSKHLQGSLGRLWMRDRATSAAEAASLWAAFGRPTSTPNPDPEAPTPEPPAPTGFDANGAKISAPTASVTASGAYTVTATVEMESTKTITPRYLQIAIRRPDGTGADGGFRPNAVLAPGSTTTLEVASTGTVSGTYTAFVTYTLAANPTQADWVDGPRSQFSVTVPTVPTTPPPTGTPNPSIKVPLLGRSLLPWNAGVFTGNGDINRANAFAAWRNRPLDSIMYFPGRDTWDAMRWLRSDLTSFPGYRIIALPTQPKPQNNVNTAAGINNTWWRDYGLLLKNTGWDDGRTILRLNWENNLGGNPYAANKPDPATFIAAYRNVVTQVRINAPKTLFNLCWNKGPDQAGSIWSAVYPGDEYVDILGLDWYDHYPAIYNDANWNQAWNQVCGMSTLVPFAKAHGKVIWFDEWGVSHWSGAGGGDNPYYIARKWQMFQENAIGNGGVVAGENTYNDPGAPATLNHVLYPASAGNPLASAAYLGPAGARRWGRG